MPEVHVVARIGAKGWVVVDSRVAGQSREDSTHDTQSAASGRGRSLLEVHEQGGELVVHKKDGDVRSTTHVDYTP